MSIFTIRLGVIGDAEEIGSLHVRVWRETYRDLMDADFLAAIDETERIDNWLEIFRTDSDEATFVAHDRANELVGFASAGRPHDADPAGDADAPRALELFVLNTLSHTHGSGLAGQLLEAALQDRPALLWVVENNHRAIAFYEKHGFSLDDAKKWDDKSQTFDVRMSR